MMPDSNCGLTSPRQQDTILHMSEPSRTVPALADVTTMLLDMDGTLLDLRFDNHFWVDHLPKRFHHIHGGDEQEVMRHVEQTLMAAEGSMAWYCVDHWADHFEVDIMSLKDEVKHLVRYRDGSLEFLRRLQSITGLHTVIVTDAHPKVLDMKHDITGLLDLVDAVVCSHDFGVPKRDPVFWQQLAGHINFKPETTVMIDDSHHVLDTARNFGIGFPLIVSKPDSGRDREPHPDFVPVNNLDELL